MFSAASAHPPGQPQSKAAPIAQLTGPSAEDGDDEVTPKTVQPHVVSRRPVRTIKESRKADLTSLQPTLSLIQRVLAPDTQLDDDLHKGTATIEDLLPPLTSSNEVDIELYAIIAIIIKDFVNTWYSKITPDHAFVDEIIQIFAHCSRALEQRLRAIDIAGVFMDEIPVLVCGHIDTYRTAKASASTSPYGTSVCAIYHSLKPHPALSPLPVDHAPSILLEQESNEQAYRQMLVQGALAVLLPTEDLQNDPLRVLVGDILADLILGQALAGKVCQAWFLHGAISKVTTVLNDKVQPTEDGSVLHDDTKSRLEEFGLLSSNSNVTHPHSPDSVQSRFFSRFWTLLQYGYLAYLFLRYVLRDLHAARNEPKRYLRRPPPSLLHVGLSEKVDLQPPTPEDLSPQPALAFGFYGLISTLLKLADRMPWVSSMLTFWQHSLLRGSGRFGAANSLLDRFLYYTIRKHVLPNTMLPLFLRNLRAALFPNNCMGPPAPPPPSLEETRKIKFEAAVSICALIPRLIAQRFYSTSDDAQTVQNIEEDILEPFDEVYLNKHLVYAIIELLLVRLIPELAEQNVSDLLIQRGVSSESDSLLDVSQISTMTLDKEKL